MGFGGILRFVGVQHAVPRWVLAALALGAGLGLGWAQIHLNRVEADTVAGFVPYSPIQIDRHTGDVPFTVSITGPPALLARVEEWVAARRDCSTDTIRGMQGFFISWGDDKDRTMTSPASSPLGPDGCPDLLKHICTTPDGFTISASLFHIGEMDGIITDWRGDTWVSIYGPEQPLEFELLAPRGGETFTLRKPVEIRWQIATGYATDLLIELLGPDDQPLMARKLEDVGYDGLGRLDFWAELGANHSLFKSGPAQVKLRMQAIDYRHRVLAWQESEEFTLSVE